MFRRSSLFPVLAAGVAGAFVVFSPGTASATVVSACGNLDFSGSESCTIETSGGCEADCTPLNCTASLEASCNGQCNVTIDANCSSTCEAKCTGRCSAGNFSCEGGCSSDCDATCSGQCSSNGNSSQCEASCQETCSAQCQASCSGQPPSCTPVTCQAECQGSCQAQANMSCQISCQENASASCTGGCKTQCQQPSGAIFCDGHFVDASDVQSCIDALVAAVNIHVALSGQGSCTGNTCQASAKASCGQIAPGNVPPLSPALIGLGLAATAAGVARRRRAARK
jgi:hypothetical protein